MEVTEEKRSDQCFKLMCCIKPLTASHLMSILCDCRRICLDGGKANVNHKPELSTSRSVGNHLKRLPVL